MWNGIWAFLGLMAFLWMIQKRFEKIEKIISKEERPISYKIGLSICPKWHEIIKWCFPERDSREVVDEIHREFKIDIGESLYQREFKFKHFYEGVSGLEMIWSDYHKTFVDKMRIWERIFTDIESMDGIAKKYDDNKIGYSIMITPEFIGFPSFDDFVPDENKIASFPYTDVVNYFSDVAKGSERKGSSLGDFPPALQKKLNEYNIKYEPDRYGDFGRPDGTHIFENKYYSIYLDMKIF